MYKLALVHINRNRSGFRLKVLLIFLFKLLLVEVITIAPKIIVTSTRLE